MADIVPPPSTVTQPPRAFDVIYADPPWRYGNMTPSASPENHYPTMSIDDICALDVPAASNAVLYLWGTAWFPNARRLEMFCRYPAPGWHVWGNQVDSSVADLPFERFDPHADPAQGDLFGGVA